MVRVEIVAQATVEQYDDAGNLVGSQSGQPMKLAAMSAEALAAALDGLRGQLAGAWSQAEPEAKE